MTGVRAGDQTVRPSPSATPGDARPIYFGAGGRQLFGWHHPVSAARCAVVICSPLGSESTGWHRASRHWAVGLARAGVAVLRFDYAGTGDSIGAEDAPHQVRSWIDSIGDAVDFMREAGDAPSIVLAGLGMGATLAMSAAAERGDCDGLVLWAPFASGRAYLREGRAFTRLMAPVDVRHDSESARRTEQFGGLALGFDTVRDLEALDPFAGGARLNADVLLIPRDAGANDSALQQRMASAGARVERRVLDGFAFVLTDAHQGEIPQQVIEGTAAWLAARHAAHPPTAQSATRGDRSEPFDGMAKALDAAATADGVDERAMHFGEQGRLFGILSSPSRALRRHTGILLVNSGAVYRVGPNRLYVSLARQWAGLGYTVLRMDIGGLGDSPALQADGENRPYSPHAVADVAAGMAALRSEGVEHVVVGGLCSGAHTTFHAGLSLDGIAGVMLMNPIVFYWKPTDSLDIGAWRIYGESRHYQQSAKSWRSWLKLISGRVNLLYVARIGWRRTSEIMRAKLTELRRVGGENSPASEDAARDLGRIAGRGTDVVLLFSEGDPGHDFLTLHHSRELARLRRRPGFRLQVIEDADHTFTTLDARQRASDVLTKHLLVVHP